MSPGRNPLRVCHHPVFHPDGRRVLANMLVNAFEAGALGYVLKHSAPSELSAAIRSALKGKIYVTSLLAGEFIEGRKKGSQERHEESSFLTRRQREVLQLLAEGRSVKASRIARSGPPTLRGRRAN